ncbi:MAG TPA: hypothetical protein VEH01_01970 [Nitrososphaerales archaeon]|nr:hypothetical protein [Nitrososphaerales archaeon]
MQSKAANPNGPVGMVLGLVGALIDFYSGYQLNSRAYLRPP